MKNVIFLLITCQILLLNSCIGDDIVEDRVDPELRIMNPIDSLQLGSQYTFIATYFNEVGIEESQEIAWTTDDNSIVSVSDNGVAQAISLGTTQLTAFTTDGSTSNTFSLGVGENPIVTEVASKNGTIEPSSFYELDGDFTITQEGDDLKIVFENNYVASSALPGLYVYLTNNPNTIGGATEISEVTVFSGAHEYLVPNQDINGFSHLLYFCKPFNVKVGDGVIN